jgi:cytochrome c oxidase subunit 3
MSSDAPPAPPSAGVPEEFNPTRPYYVPGPSPWPLAGAFGGAVTLAGIVIAAHFGQYWLLVLGFLMVGTVMVFWWRTVIAESVSGKVLTPVTRLGLRYGMTLFISSEVMLFVAFFWTFFNFAIFPENVSGANAPLWPPMGIHTFNPFSLPIMNTMILLLSGFTITWAHHSLIEGDRKSVVAGLGLTVLLGLLFTSCQAIEYSEAPWSFSGGGIYPAIFFIATGFHGAHVIIGTCFLIVCFFRARANQFTPVRHFGFEAAAWYWHFVDVVWLFLFVCIYWWGAGPTVHE